MALSTPLFAALPVDASTAVEPAVDPMFMIREAGRRIDRADFVGAKIQLALAMKVVVDHPPEDGLVDQWFSGALQDIHAHPKAKHPIILEILYLYAGVLQEESNTTEAIALFEAILKHIPNSDRHADVLFRCANAHSMMANTNRSRVLLQQLSQQKPFTKIDRKKVALTKKAFQFRIAPSPSRTNALTKRMKRMPNSYFRQYRASIGLELLQYLAQENDALHFTGSQRQIIRHHRLRSKNHQLSVTQLEQIIQLQQPTQVARALALIAQGLMDTGDALFASPAPSELSEEQQKLYREQINVYVKNTWLNALRYSTEGVHLSTRLDLGEPLKTKMASLKEAISGRIEQLN